MIPWLECDHTITPSPVNRSGVKGVGEAGTDRLLAGDGELGCGCAAPLGIKHVDMPMTPQRIWNLMQGAQA
jgi:carbon-monoxide dehydrogenase large subunit